jgi:hypothetical protein
MFRLPTKFYSPEGDAPAGGGPMSSDKDDVINFLGDEDPTEKDEPLDLTPPKKEKAEKTDEESDESDDTTDDAEDEDADGEEPEDDEAELEDLLEETEEPDAEKLELTTPVRRKEILKKYPNLFKDFPYLEKAYYREQQFTEIVPTLEDAREAVRSKQTLDRFEQELMGGNVQTIFKAVKDEDPNSFYRIVDNLLPMLASVDEAAYHHLLGNNIKHTITAMVQEARRSNNEVLLSAAQILNQFTFGTSDFVPPSKLSKEAEKQDDPKENQLSQREKEFTQRQFTIAKESLNTRLNNTLKATIEAHIDPRGSMGEFVKKAAIRQVTEELNNLISKDSRFRVITDKLWAAAHKANYDKESMDRIRSAYLSKSKTLLAPVIKKARNEALKGMGKRVRETVDETEETTSPTKKSRSTERPRSDNSGKKSGGIPAGMSSLDFLNS